MIRCLVDEDSFDKYPSPHNDLNALGDMIEYVAQLVYDEQILNIPDDFQILITCNPELLPWDSPGQHCADKQIVFLSGIYPLDDLIQFLSHELIHVEQVEEGFLRQVYIGGRPAMEWFGIILQTEDDIPDEQYRALPWERDAYDREHEVYRAIRDRLDDEVYKALWQGDTDAIRSVNTVNKLLN